MKFLAAIGGLVLGGPFVFLVLLCALWWRTWWLYPAWGWYLEPLGVPHISFWHFTGLMTLIVSTTHQSDTKKDERKEDWYKLIANIILQPIMLWFILWWLQRWIVRF